MKRRPNRRTLPGRALTAALVTAILAGCASDGASSGTTTATTVPTATVAPTTAPTTVAPTAAPTTAASATAASTTVAPTTAVPTTVAPTPSTAPPVLTGIDPGDGGNYSPAIDPSRFASVVDNRYLPFRAGMKWMYESVNESGEHETTTVEVLTDTRTVMGVPTTVVHDVVEVGGNVVEDTKDWYAQDVDGNVWYFGEDTTAFESAGPTKEGSWEAGVDGAVPGIVMPAAPQVGANGYRQEFRRGEAEDMAQVVAVGVDQTVRTTYHDVVVTQEWTPLEPDVTEQKSYAPDVGVITEDIVRGGTEHVELVSFSGPG